MSSQRSRAESAGEKIQRASPEVEKRLRHPLTLKRSPYPWQMASQLQAPPHRPSPKHSNASFKRSKTKKYARPTPTLEPATRSTRYISGNGTSRLIAPPLASCGNETRNQGVRSGSEGKEKVGLWWGLRLSLLEAGM